MVYFLRVVVSLESNIFPDTIIFWSCVITNKVKRNTFLSSVSWSPLTGSPPSWLTQVGGTNVEMAGTRSWSKRDRPGPPLCCPLSGGAQAGLRATQVVASPVGLRLGRGPWYRVTRCFDCDRCWACTATSGIHTDGELGLNEDSSSPLPTCTLHCENIPIECK